MKTSALALIACLLTGCSAQQSYQAFQSMEQSRCIEQPANQYRECIERSSLTFEEYQALRSQSDKDEL